MTTNWMSSYTLLDDHNFKSSMRFAQEIGGATPDIDFAAALIAHNLLQTALEAVTDATVYSSLLTSLVDGSATLPADEVDITDVAFVVTHINLDGEIGKYHTLRIPAPIDGMFESDGVTVDKTDAPLIAFVLELANDFLVSDGESINVSEGEDGIASGYWASVKKSSK